MRDDVRRPDPMQAFYRRPAPPPRSSASKGVGFQMKALFWCLFGSVSLFTAVMSTNQAWGFWLVGAITLMWLAVTVLWVGFLLRWLLTLNTHKKPRADVWLPLLVAGLLIAVPKSGVPIKARFALSYEHFENLAESLDGDSLKTPVNLGLYTVKRASVIKDRWHLQIGHSGLWVPGDWGFVRAADPPRAWSAEDCFWKYEHVLGDWYAYSEDCGS